MAAGNYRGLLVSTPAAAYRYAQEKKQVYWTSLRDEQAQRLKSKKIPSRVETELSQKFSKWDRRAQDARKTMRDIPASEEVLASYALLNLKHEKYSDVVLTKNIFQKK